MIRDGDRLIAAIQWRDKCLNWLKTINSVEHGDWLHWQEYEKANRN